MRGIFTTVCSPRRLALLVFVSLTFAHLAHGQLAGAVERPLLAVDVPDATKRARVVALLPIKPAATSASQLFVRSNRQQHLVEQLTQRLSAALQAHDFVEFIGPVAVQQRLSADSLAARTRRVAQERYRLGVEYYMSMAFDRAAKSTLAAAQMYLDAFQDVIDPKPLADAFLIRGVSLVQDGRQPPAHVALKKMFAMQPDRVFSRRGFYGVDVDAAFVRASQDEALSGKKDQPYGDATRLRQLTTRLGANAMITAAVARSSAGSFLVISFFRADHGVFTGQARIDLEDIDQPGSSAGPAIDAFISRMMACVPVKERDNQSPRRRSAMIWMDTSAVGGAFLRKPTRLQFFSLGFAAGVEQQLRPGFGFFGRFNVLSSLPDPYRDLVRSFNSLRGIAGVSFAMQWRRLRVFLKPGMEVHVLGSAVATRDPDCKFFGLDHWTCNQTNAVTKRLEQDVLVGVNAAIGAQFAIGRGFFATMQTSGAFYFLPLDGTGDINLPVVGEIGLGYRF